MVLRAGFREKSVPERLTFVKQNEICQNCLNDEASEKCYSTSKCVICKRQHHSLLHLRTTGNVQNNAQNISTHVLRSGPLQEKDINEALVKSKMTLLYLQQH